jgi:hypothetical protein
MESISREEFDSWKGDKVTKAVFDLIKENIDERTEMMARGELLGENCEARYSNIVGYIAAMDSLVNMEFNDVGDDYDH